MLPTIRSTSASFAPLLRRPIGLNPNFNNPNGLSVSHTTFWCPFSDQARFASSFSRAFSASSAPPATSMAAALPFLEASKKPEGTMVSCHVRPNAQESAIQLESGEDDLALLQALPVRLAAAPREGEANKEIETVIAKTFGLRKNQCSLVRGGKSRDKVILCEGLTVDTAAAVLLKMFPRPAGAKAPAPQQQQQQQPHQQQQQKPQAAGKGKRKK